jgi:hypothetical protein
MKTPKEYLNENLEETNIPNGWYENEIAEMMDWYAKYYHETKQLELTAVVQVCECEKEYFSSLEVEGNKCFSCRKPLRANDS